MSVKLSEHDISVGGNKSDISKDCVERSGGGNTYLDKVGGMSTGSSVLVRLKQNGLDGALPDLLFKQRFS